MNKPIPLYVAPSTISGRGIFSHESYQPGDIIEICPVIRIPGPEQSALDSTCLYNYYFSWQEDNAIALGFGSLYNHSYEPNALYKKQYDDDQLHFVCLSHIPAGKEITVNYNGDPALQTPVWFDRASDT